MMRGSIHTRVLSSEPLLSGSLLFLFLALPASLHSSAAGAPQWLPAAHVSEALQDSDLDARDARNRPVRAGRRRAELRELFIGTVFQLLATADLPALAAARKALEALTPWSQRLARAAHRANREAWSICSAIKKTLAPPGRSWRFSAPPPDRFAPAAADLLSALPFTLHIVPIRC